MVIRYSNREEGGKMKAVLYYGPREIKVEDLPQPRITESEILVRVRACGICGTDLHMYRLGMFEALGRPVNQGRIMGHEFSGEVIEAGSRVSGLRIGDRITGVGIGVFAEYVPVEVTAKGPYLLPDNINFEVGATLEPLATSRHGVRLAELAGRETVVILGAGIIRLGCIQVIRALVSCRILVVDSSALRLDVGKKLSADATINLKEVDPVEAVIELTEGARPIERLGIRGGNADVVMDCAGDRLCPGEGLRMVKPNGRIILVALYEEQPKLDFNQLVRRHVTIHGSWAWTGDNYRQAIELVSNGNIDRKPLISHVYPLIQAVDAFAIQDKPEAGIKVLLKP